MGYEFSEYLNSPWWHVYGLTSDRQYRLYCIKYHLEKWRSMKVHVSWKHLRFCSIESQPLIFHQTLMCSGDLHAAFRATGLQYKGSIRLKWYARWGNKPYFFILTANPLPCLLGRNIFIFLFLKIERILNGSAVLSTMKLQAKPGMLLGNMI